MTVVAKRLSMLLPTVVLLGAAAMTMSSALADGARAGIAPPVRLAEKKVFIRGGCPYNLDKECIRDHKGRLVKCRCVS